MISGMSRVDMNDTGDFAANLRFLCAQERSVSQVCREIGINRQQFARYLDGRARPSAHNLWRICRYFDVAEDDISAPRAVFARRRPDTAPVARAEVLTDAFPGDISAMRRMAGSYHSFFLSPSHPEHVICAYVDIFERDGLFHSRTVERIRHPETGQVSRARFVGLVSMHDGTLFMVERGRITRGGISETVLAPVHRGSRTWFAGLLLGFSWRNLKPYASQCVWKRLRATLGAREALSQCGAMPIDSRRLDPIVLEQLGAG